MPLRQNTMPWRPGQNTNWLLSTSCGFAMLGGCLRWCGGPTIRATGRFMARGEKSSRHRSHIDSDRAFADRAFPTTSTTLRRARSVCSASAFAMGSALPEVRGFRLRAVDGRLDDGAPLHTVHLQWQTTAIGTVSKQQQQHQESIS